ncbi:putative leucine-rich repeat-containing protein DDB_G0290503 [Argopecten irradians]|uniref:putative leucine-rich repeat-containing protein DDB_G0290503 n=1 Tax=Argopecten irradians TaxID=31199 RepID=UPI00371275DA
MDDIETTTNAIHSRVDNIEKLHRNEVKILLELEKQLQKENLRINKIDNYQQKQQNQIGDIESKQQVYEDDLNSLKQQRTTHKQFMDGFEKDWMSVLNKVEKLGNQRLVGQYSIVELVKMRQEERRRISNLEKQRKNYQQELVRIKKQQKRNQQCINKIEIFEKLNNRISNISKQRKNDEFRIALTEKNLRYEQSKIAALRKELKRNQLGIVELQKRRFSTKYAIADLENQNNLIQFRIAELMEQREKYKFRLNTLENSQGKQLPLFQPNGEGLPHYGNYKSVILKGNGNRDGSTKRGNKTFAFHAVLTKAISKPRRFSVIQYDDVVTNIGGAYNPISGVFTCSVKGAYVFGWTALVSEEYLCTELMINDKIVGTAFSGGKGISDASVSGSSVIVVKLEVGDRVWIRINELFPSVDILSRATQFSGFKIW